MTYFPLEMVLAAADQHGSPATSGRLQSLHQVAPRSAHDPEAVSARSRRYVHACREGKVCQHRPIWTENGANGQPRPQSSLSCEARQVQGVQEEHHTSMLCLQRQPPHRKLLPILPRDALPQITMLQLHLTCIHICLMLAKNC